MAEPLWVTSYVQVCQTVSTRAPKSRITCEMDTAAYDKAEVTACVPVANTNFIKITT